MKKWEEVMVGSKLKLTYHGQLPWLRMSWTIKQFIFNKGVYIGINKNILTKQASIAMIKFD